MISKLTVPTIHWNGTGKETLEGEYAQAYAAVSTALDKLRAVTVHGRNYYVQDAEAGIRAIKEHLWRVEQLEQVHQELETILIAIQQQEKRG